MRKLLPALLLAGSVLAQDDPADRFPEAEGKENVTGTCSACHTLVRVATNRRTAKAWAATIKIHQEQRGLKLEAEEIPPIVDYLAAWFGPMVNINAATADEFAGLPQIDKKLAAAIVAFRDRNGPFKTVDALGAVEGFPAPLLAKLKQRLETGATRP